MNAQHSKNTGEWYTPIAIVDAAREALGGEIGLDPATCALAQERVRAKRIGTLEAPANASAWLNAATIFLNPPTPPRCWWEMLAAFWWLEMPSTRRAIYVAYSIEQLQQSHGWLGGGMLLHRVIIPAKRIAYDTKRETLIEKIDRQVLAASTEIARLEAYDQTYGIESESQEARDMDRARRVLANLRDKRAALLAGPALVPGDAPPHAGAIVLLGDVNPKPLLSVLGGTLIGPL